MVRNGGGIMSDGVASRGEVTAELSRLVEKRLMRLTPFWASEVFTEIDRHCSPRVDFMAYAPDFRMVDAGSEGAIEHGEFWFFEVKSCMADFESGHGLTFEGDRNFLVCPRDLAEELYGSNRLPKNASVLCPDKLSRRLITVFNGQQTHRKHSAALLLFLMMQRIRNGGYIPSHEDWSGE